MKTVKVYNSSKNALPEYKTPMSAGLDLRADIAEPITIKPMQRVNIRTGLHIELPVGCEAQIRSRSGLADKYGVIVLNSPGTVDADYRGNIGIPLINLGQEDFVVNPGDRIAQMVIARYETIEFEEVDSIDMLSKTERGAGGFCSTGIK